MKLFVLLFVGFLNFDQTRSQTIGAFAGASIGDILVPQKDTLSNRIVSFIANQIFASDVLPQLNDVRFYLWTRLNPFYGMQLLINRTDILDLSTFNRFKPVKVLIHGFGGNGTDDRFVSKARDSYLLLADFNVITVDWSSLAEYPNYARAAISTTPVGTYVADFLDFLISQGTPPSAFHIIGYSLGAHVAGSAGNALRLGRLPRITGLEPAGGYERIEKLRSLSSKDATFVDVIHTNANILGLGTTSSIGHADFYPNGGRWQYGCIWNTEYDSLITAGRRTISSSLSWLDPESSCRPDVQVILGSSSVFAMIVRNRLMKGVVFPWANTPLPKRQGLTSCIRIPLPPTRFDGVFEEKLVCFSKYIRGRHQEIRDCGTSRNYKP